MISVSIFDKKKILQPNLKSRNMKSQFFLHLLLLALMTTLPTFNCDDNTEEDNHDENEDEEDYDEMDDDDEGDHFPDDEDYEDYPEDYHMEL